ncbi:hypothetical protein [Oceanospirillum beijerinckii]|uniref:hypothetical protein n=1 Tax=Oceanospirillum beijerinckii TaxID=64976 RepID=UPI000404D3FC|nr:hypothetical protein [Oceanospirillum beijerinckii]
MKFTPQLDANGQVYWLVEIRVRGRMLMAEGNTFSEAVSNAIDLLCDANNLTLPHVGVSHV